MEQGKPSLSSRDPSQCIFPFDSPCLAPQVLSEKTKVGLFAPRLLHIVQLISPNMRFHQPSKYHHLVIQHVITVITCYNQKKWKDWPAIFGLISSPAASMGGCDLVRLGQLGLPAACSSTLDPALHVVPENGLVLGPKYTGNPWLVGGIPTPLKNMKVSWN